MLLDQLVAAPIENLHLPVSDDARIRQLTEGMLSCPADKSTLGQWAQRIGMSERSLSRTLQQQMGMSFGHWRRQLHVMLALQRLTQGERADGGAGSGLRERQRLRHHVQKGGRQTAGALPRSATPLERPGRRNYHVKAGAGAGLEQVKIRSRRTP